MAATGTSTGSRVVTLSGQNCKEESTITEQKQIILFVLHHADMIEDPDERTKNLALSLLVQWLEDH